MPEAPLNPKIVKIWKHIFLQIKEENLMKILCKSHWQNTKSKE